MKLLLDECTPKRLTRDFPGHEVHTVDQAGLKGLKNGALLREASQRFDALITVDQNLPFQHRVESYPIAVVIMVSRSNRYSDLKLLTPRIIEALLTIAPGEIIRIQ
jgi:predicted nuclease of predicted toxin-antitoxin system